MLFLFLSNTQIANAFDLRSLINPHVQSANSVEFFQNCEYKGAKKNLYAGKYKGRRGSFSGVSSFSMPNGWIVIIYSEINFRGHRKKFTRGTHCLSHNWNDNIRSVKIFTEFLKISFKLFSVLINKMHYIVI